MKKQDVAPDDDLKCILKRFKIAKDAWSSIHDSYVSDTRFAQGDQWDPAVKKLRDAQSLTSLVYNVIPSKVKYIVNNARSNCPSIKCSPVSSGATKNTAKIYDGIIKHIQYKYNANSAYINGLDNTCVGGIGAWKVLPITDGDEYDIEISRITDPTTVYFDPNAKKQDFSDAKYVFLSQWMSKDEFEDLWPDADQDGISKTNKGMFTKDSVQVLEYWCINDETGLAEQYLVTGSEILSHNNEYRGKFLPIVYMAGEECHIDGERTFKGIVRDIRDMQILLNLTKSRTADYISRASNQQWLVEADQIADYKDVWLSSNVNGIGVLPYKATAAGKPDRLDAPAPPVGFQSVSQEADADIRASIGIKDPTVDLPTTQSGKAIALQISQGNLGTYQYHDKLKAAIKWTGTIIVDLIPHYFSYPHVREIMGLDGQVEAVPLNQPFIDNDEEVMHDLSIGKYSVIISDGPSYESQRSEAADKLLEAVKIYPDLMPIAGDIIFRNLTFEGSNEIADRLMAQMPPNILAASSSSNGDKKAQMVQNQMAQMQQQMEQLQQQNQQLQQLLDQASREKDAKTNEIQTRGQVDMQLKAMDHQHDLQMAQVTNTGKTQDTNLKGHLDIKKIHEKANADAHLEILKSDLDIKEEVIVDSNPFLMG